MVEFDLSQTKQVGDYIDMVLWLPADMYMLGSF